MTSNQLRYWGNVETERSNRARERETHRANRESEKETHRANVARETETHRHNVETERLTSQANAESARHNQATELQAQTNLAFNYAELAETKRSHMANEENASRQVMLGYANLGLGYAQLQESTRAHQAAEKAQMISLNDQRYYNDQQAELSRQRNEETARHNKAQEDQSRLDWIGRLKSTSENVRHNTTTEGFEETQMPHRIAQGYLNSAASVARAGAAAAK